MPGAAATRYSLSTAQQRFSLLNPGPPEIPDCLLPDLNPTSAETTTRCLKKHRVQAVISQGLNPRGQNSGIWQREDIIARVLIESRIASVAPGARNLFCRGREQ